MEDEPEVQDQEQQDPSHEMDLETVFQSFGTEAEMESMSVQSLLTANSIPAIIVGSSSLPNLPFEVQVPHEQAAEALRLIEESAVGGPEAADEAERAFEASAGHPG